MAPGLPQACDLLVVGSGCGALSSAVTAAHLGLDVVVVEKEPLLGGTTAWSGGWMFVPRNPLAREAGIDEDVAEPRRYLRAVCGRHFRAARVEAFLAHGPAAVQFHRDRTALRFVDGNAVPDFHGRAPGARTGGRSVCAAPFDGRRLGADLARLRPPCALWSFAGMSIGGDLRHFLRAGRAWDSAAHVARRLLRHGWDLLRHGRGTLRMGGNALAAALLKSALDAGVRVFEGHEVVGLLTADGPAAAPPSPPPDPLTGVATDAPGASAPRVDGARIRTADGRLHEVRARRGVVLACGGFPHDAQRQAELFGHVGVGGGGHWSAAPVANRGDGLRLGESVGGRVDRDVADAGAWCPVSLVPRPGGRVQAFPHLVERGKPGLIAVDAHGRRFVDEAGDYHSFMRALFARCAGHDDGRDDGRNRERHVAPDGAGGGVRVDAGEGLDDGAGGGAVDGAGAARRRPPRAWLVCDHRFQRRFGLGHAKPFPLPIGAALRSGYLRRAASLEGLAAVCGIDPAGLSATVARYNVDARAGRDPAHGRGSVPYDRMQGDAEHAGPNPCVAPIERGPFYAVEVVPGSLGTFAGLEVDVHARVLDRHGRPVEGLYAAGNDMSSVMGGHYPSGGITLGPALVFGYVLAHHAAGQALPMPVPPDALAASDDWGLDDPVPDDPAPDRRTRDGPARGRRRRDASPAIVPAVGAAALDRRPVR